MEYFTPEDLTPSAVTLNIIRQVAYAYNAARQGGKVAMCYMN